MRFKILGPLEISDDNGDLVTITRRLQRRMLTLLLLNADRPCSTAELVAGLWGDSPPKNPEASLRGFVYGVRNLLPDRELLRTHSHGYAIGAGPGELDLHLFRDLADRGHDALHAGDPAMASRLLTGALALWRDPPLADMPAAVEADRLLAERAQAREALIDSRLALGDHRQLIAELRCIVATEPMREHSWAQLMTALYRCGARAEALGAYGRLRMTLITTHGIEPGPELQELHRLMLADEPALMTTARFNACADGPGASRTSAALAGGSAVTAGAVVDGGTAVAAGGSGTASGAVGMGAAVAVTAQAPLCQLPAAVADFTGREAELAELNALLPGPEMAVIVLTGMLGIGKTALALRTAHRARPRFPDGQLYICLDDNGRPRDAHVALGELLRGLGIPAHEIPGLASEREALFRSMLAGRRVLLVADGVTSAAQVRPLLPGTAGSAVVVTSRARLAELDGARIIELDCLLPADAVSMVARISGRDPLELKRSAIAAACGHLPLALRFAGSRLAAECDLPSADLARRLGDERQMLDQLVVGEASLRSRLCAAADALCDPARGALAMLAAMGPGDVPGTVIATLAGDAAGPTAAKDLADAGLMIRVAGVSYRTHAVVRAYAAELLGAAEVGVIGTATGRLIASGWLEPSGLSGR